MGSSIGFYSKRLLIVLASYSFIFMMSFSLINFVNPHHISENSLYSLSLMYLMVGIYDIFKFIKINTEYVIFVIGFSALTFAVSTISSGDVYFIGQIVGYMAVPVLLASVLIHTFGMQNNEDKEISLKI